MNVPLLNLEKHHAPIRGEMLSALERVLDSNYFVLGEEVDGFESRLAEHCGCSHAVGVSSGTDALLVALMALGVGPGDEVITTPFSFFATAGCVARLGATPVFVDIDPRTFNINTELIESAITPKTKVVIPVHLFGQCADMNPILKIAEQHGLKVLEDAAQAIGSQYPGGGSAGTVGDMGCLSFFPSKNLGALGDGGMVLTNDDELADMTRILRSHGSRPKYYNKHIGGNFRLDAMQAAVLNVKLPHLPNWTERRQQNAQRYNELLAGLVDRGLVQTPVAAYADQGVENHHIYNQYVIRVDERDRFREFLNEKEIGSEVYYPVPFHLQECFTYLGYKLGDFPESELAANKSVAIPIDPELTPEQQEFVASAMEAFFAS